MVRPIFVSEADVTPSLVMNVDYGTREPLGSPSYSSASGGSSVWDVAPWDTSDWESGDIIVKKNGSLSLVLGILAGLELKLHLLD